jgi:hypothetical protein
LIGALQSSWGYALKALGDHCVRKLKPFLQTTPRIKGALSGREGIGHGLQRRYPLSNGGSGDVVELPVSVQNDGEPAAPDFKLQLDIPSEFMDGAPPLGLRRPDPPGLSRFGITNEEGAARMNYLYPKTKSQTFITLNYAVRNDIKRQHPDPS